MMIVRGVCGGDSTEGRRGERLAEELRRRADTEHHREVSEHRSPSDTKFNHSSPRPPGTLTASVENSGRDSQGLTRDTRNP